MQVYQQHTSNGEIDRLADNVRRDIESEIQREDSAFFRNDPRSEPLKPQLARILKDAKAKDHEKARKGARGISG